MKIDNVILVSNENPDYLNWWPVVSRLWKERIGINPLLILVTDQGGNSNPTEKYGKVVRIKPYEGLSIAGQTSLLRLWYHFNSNKVNMLVDIEYLPISKYWYSESISGVADSEFVYINSYVYPVSRWRHIFSANVSRGSTFRNKFIREIGKPNNFYEFIELAKKFTKQHEDAYNYGRKTYWGLDEVLLSTLMTDYKSINAPKVPDVWNYDKLVNLGLKLLDKDFEDKNKINSIINNSSFTIPARKKHPRNNLTDKLIYGNNYSRLISISYPYKLEWFKEWIEWNIKLGFSKILVGIDSRFNSFELPKYDKVEYVVYNRDKEDQRVFYKRYLSDDKYAWNACIDDDEFISIKGSINDYIFNTNAKYNTDKLCLPMVPLLSTSDDIVTTPVKECTNRDNSLNYYGYKSIIRSGDYNVDSVHLLDSKVKGYTSLGAVNSTVINSVDGHLDVVYHYHDKGKSHHEFLASRGRAVKSNVNYSSIPDKKVVGKTDNTMKLLIYGK